MDRCGKGLLPLAAWLLALLVVAGIPGASRSVGQEAAPGASGPGAATTLTRAGALEGNLEADAYILGPGDVLEIGFWGEVNRGDKVVINPDGDALVHPLGPVRLAGLALSRARDLIKERLAPYYRPGVLSVSLVSIRSFRVHVVGMVADPGAFEANAVTRVSEAITLAGGLLPDASQRGIRLVRGTDTLRVDLKRYLLLGDNHMNPFLNDGDVVYVPPGGEIVEVYGSVYRQGPYEFVEGETLGDLIELAGGLRPEAYADSLEIKRFRADDPTVSESVALTGGPAAAQDFALTAGDRAFVRSIPDWHADARVAISGEVRRPGIYVIEEGVDVLSALIARAGGLTDKASLAEARLVRGLYASTKFPVEAWLDTLRTSQDFLTEKEIDLVGTLSREPKGAVSVRFEEVLTGEHGRLDPLLYNGDVIDIPRSSWSVRVSGQVKNPGLVAFKPGAGSGYYIKQAGGFAPGADSHGTKLVTALSGQMVSPGGMRIRPGDIVWVPRKTDHSWWAMTKDILQVLAQAATVYVVADQIASK